MAATVIQPVADGQRVIDLGVSHRGSAIEVAWSDSRRSHRTSIDTTLFGCVRVQSDLLGRNRAFICWWAGP